MLILVTLLLIGFIKAGMKEGWFETMMGFVGY